MSQIMTRILLAFVPIVGFGSADLRAVAMDDPPAKPLTEKDYEEFGRKLEMAVGKGDRAAMDQLLPISNLFERAVSDLELPPKQQQAILNGAKSAKDTFAQQILGEIKKGGKYTLLRTHKVEGERRVLMRMITQEGAVNYHDFLLTRSSDGQVVMEDIYVFLSGEMLSSTMRRLLFNLLANATEGLAEKLKGADQLYMKNINEVVKMSTAARAGRTKEALTIFRKLPEELQKDKALQLMAIVAAQAGDEADYLIELERFRKANPKDASIDFISIDFYILKKQYAEAVKALDRVDKNVGGDPFLQILKGGILNQAGKYAEAKPIVEKAIQAEPKLVLGYLIRVSISLEEKNHADTLTWLKKIEESGLDQIDLETISKVEDYAAFAKSPEFGKLKKWLAERKK